MERNSGPDRRPTAPFVVHLGSFFGIQIKLHYAMVLVVALILLHVLFEGIWVVFGVLIASALLHELAHAVVASRFGVRAKDLWVSPIGGHLRFDRMPKDSEKEMAIAIAGPALNFLIAGAAYAVWYVLRPSDLATPTFWQDFPLTVSKVNLAFAVFNLLPAFPLDGGRIVRAWLARSRTRVEATRIPARLGRWVALGIVVLSIVTKVPGSGFVLPEIPLIPSIFAALYVLALSQWELFSVQAQAARGESDSDEPPSGGSGDGLGVGPSDGKARPVNPSEFSGGEIIDADG